MANHTKPTPEELQAGIDNAAKELEKMSLVPEVEPEPETPPETPEVIPEPTDKEQEPIPEIDYKKKFVDSTREAQILHAQNKKINETIETAMKIPEPPDEELVKQYPEWDSMTDTEKRLAKDNYISTKRFSMLEEVTRESKDIEAWNQKVDAYLEDPKNVTNHPQLEGKLEEFKIFATKPTRRGVDFDDLVKSFLWDVATMNKTKSKGAMFETGTGGLNEKVKPKSDKISLAEARNLMKSDYNKYKEYLVSGKIDDSEL